MSHDDAIQEARDRRFALHQAMLDLEHSVQSPAATPTWRDDLVVELRDLSDALDDHINTVEGPDGIIETAVTRSPRTESRGQRLRDDHPVLRKQLTEVLNALESNEEISEDIVVDIRGDVAELLVGLYRHRAHGSDFVWEAYDLDIGGAG